MPDYSKGKIYAIRSNDTEEVYIGSTTQSLSVRMAGHRCDFKRFNLGKYHYVSSYEILKLQDAYIELLEEIKCGNIEQLHQREGYYIRQFNCVNMVVAGQSKKEYTVRNWEKIKEKNKEYYDDHKHLITFNQSKKVRYTCSCGVQLQTGNTNQHLQSAFHLRNQSCIS